MPKPPKDPDAMSVVYTDPDTGTEWRKFEITKVLNLTSTAVTMGYLEPTEFQRDYHSGLIPASAIAQALMENRKKKNPSLAKSKPKPKLLPKNKEEKADETSLLSTFEQERMADYARDFDSSLLKRPDWDDLHALAKLEANRQYAFEQMESIRNNNDSSQLGAFGMLVNKVQTLTDTINGIKKSMGVDKRSRDAAREQETGVEIYNAALREGNRFMDELVTELVCDCGLGLGWAMAFYESHLNQITLWCANCELTKTVIVKHVGITYDPSIISESGAPKVMTIQQPTVKGEWG